MSKVQIGLLVGWLVGFLTSTSTTRLYRGRAKVQKLRYNKLLKVCNCRVSQNKILNDCLSSVSGSKEGKCKTTLRVLRENAQVMAPTSTLLLHCTTSVLLGKTPNLWHQHLLSILLHCTTSVLLGKTPKLWHQHLLSILLHCTTSVLLGKTPKLWHQHLLSILLHCTTSVLLGKTPKLWHQHLLSILLHCTTSVLLGKTPKLWQQHLLYCSTVQPLCY